MKLMPDWLLSAISDGGDPPCVSVSRVIALITIVATVVLPMTMWFWLSGLNSKLQDFPSGLIAFTPLASGVALTMFAANKRSDNQTTPTPPSS